MKILAAVLLMVLCSTTMGEEKQKSAREQRCGTDTDCVTVKDATGGGQLLVDGLDLSDKKAGHTVATVEQRLPGWFGPKRPLDFHFDGELLNREVPLAMYDIKIADVIEMSSRKESEL
eukprot:TRINITY_DN16933_c0_g1_i1.p1 TRINITY_DN16933_c0_g1~~TRINITY_DN16933_c0_g1_i1.p1  ORF type:complete len:118 (+),score=29.67 TRINITY_DN16933_c0_g1_i1:52-405(+)